MVCNYKYPISQSINPIFHQKSVVLGGVCGGEDDIHGNSITVHGNSTTDDEDKTINFGSQFFSQSIDKSSNIQKYHFCGLDFGIIFTKFPHKKV